MERYPKSQAASDAIKPIPMFVGEVRDAIVGRGCSWKLSAGNPWSSPENKQSVYDYNFGLCPRSDALFARSVLLPVPSCLTPAHEDAAIKAIKDALRTQPAGR